MRLYSNAMFLTNLSFYAHRGFSEFLREQHAKLGRGRSYEEAGRALKPVEP